MALDALPGLRRRSRAQRWRRQLRHAWHWWTVGRWEGTLKAGGELSALRRTRDERRQSGMGGDDEDAAPRKPRYEFAPGVVDVRLHTEGSGALLETRVEEIVSKLARCQHEASASPRPTSSAAARDLA